jgi:NhaP-type Na+/H+ or K+/H+ antiporter
MTDTVLFLIGSLVGAVLGVVGFYLGIWSERHASLRDTDD